MCLARIAPHTPVGLASHCDKVALTSQPSSQRAISKSDNSRLLDRQAPPLTGYSPHFPETTLPLAPSARMLALNRGRSPQRIGVDERDHLEET